MVLSGNPPPLRVLLPTSSLLGRSVRRPWSSQWFGDVAPELLSHLASRHGHVAIGTMSRKAFTCGYYDESSLCSLPGRGRG